MTKGGITMKKIYFACICTALAVMTSCDLQLIEPIDSDMENSKDTVVTQVVFNIEANHPDDRTKAVKTNWETNDVIFVFFSKQTAPAYLELKWNGSKWVTTSHDLSFTSNETGTMRAVYLPFGSDETITADGTNYKFSTTHYAYYLTASLSYALIDGSIDGTFNMQIPDGYVQFFVDKDNNILEGDLTLPIELREPHLTPMGVASVSADGKVNTSSLAHGAPMPGYDYKNGFLFSGILEESARNEALGYMFTMVQGGGDGMYYRISFQSNPVAFYTSSSSRRAIKFTETYMAKLLQSGQAVDMGTNANGKRVYWCKVNLGGSTKTDYGYYLAWGELEPYYEWGHGQENPQQHWRSGKENGYDWSSYKYCNGTENTITKYCDNSEWWGGSGEPDGLRELLPEDDAVTQMKQQASLRLGYWRTPTKTEITALINNCTWTHFDDFENSGVGGMLATSNITGNSIFLPYSGWRANTTLRNVGTAYAIYNSASLITNEPQYVSGLCIRTDWEGHPAHTTKESRQSGFPTRPVSD